MTRGNPCKRDGDPPFVRFNASSDRWYALESDQFDVFLVFREIDDIEHKTIFAN
jgi:hypothetical protein